MVEALARRMARGIAAPLSLGDDDREVLEFASKLLVVCVLDVTVILAVACLLRVVPQVVTAYLTVVVLKSFAGGAHASRVGPCLVTGILVYSAIGLLARAAAPLGQGAAWTGYTTVAVVAVFAFLRHAPAPPPHKPIKIQARRKALRTGSLLALASVLAASLVWLLRPFTEPGAFWAALLGMVWQSLILFPATQRLFSRL
ncbi:MAG: accessory gene regulator B family protein [Bacillota bacterium]